MKAHVSCLGVTVTAWMFKVELVTVERMNDWVGAKDEVT
jgi:hypothetical protein